MSQKAALLESIQASLAARLERLSQAARDAHAAATDPGSKAESKYDTRSLEASYLASGQARQVDDAAEAVRLFTNLILPDFDLDQPIAPGALVELELDDTTAVFLLVPAAGGMVVEHDAREITLLSPASALYRQLLGLRVGDTLDDPEGYVAEIS